MRALLILLLTLLFGQTAQAQTTTLPVRAGEHADFTRIVIQIPDANHWRVTAEGRRARVHVTGPPLRFDLRQTFSKIPRTRLRDAQAGPDWLELELACDCEVDASEDIPGFLIIDLRGAPSSVRPASSARVKPKARPGDLQQSPPRDSTAALRAGRDLARLTREGSPQRPGETSLTLDTLFRPAASPSASIRSAPDQPGTDRLAITQELARALSGSVAQGILQGNEGFQPQLSDRAPLSTTLPADLAAHVRLTTTPISGVDLTDTAGPSRGCHEADTIDMSLWEHRHEAGRVDLSLQQLFGEFDRLDEAAVIAAVRDFILLGFGAEARMVLSLLPDQTSEHRLLARLGHLVDLEIQAPLTELQDIRECNAFAYLWAFLDRSRDQPMTALRNDLLFQAVSQLPPLLRLHLGPEVIQRLTIQGEREAAQSIRATVDRITGDTPPSLELARVALDLPQAPASEAARIEARLEPERSDDALLFLLAQREAQDAPIEESLQINAEDRLLALRNTPEGRRLARLLLRAALRAGEFTKAVAVFEEQRPFLGDDEQAAMTDLFEGLLARADDLSFVTLTFRMAPWETADMKQDVRMALADRLRDLGFDDQAQLLMDATTPDLPDQSDDSADAPAQGSQMEDMAPGTQSTSVSETATEVTVQSDTALEGIADPMMEAPQAFAAQTGAESGSGQENPAPPGPAQVLSQEPAPESALASTPPTEQPLSDLRQSGAEIAERDPRAPGQEPGLLAQGRDTLAESVALRESMRALLDTPDSP